MKKRYLYLTAGALFLVLLVALHSTGALSSLQGKFLFPNYTHIGGDVEYSLSASSPSGSQEYTATEGDGSYDAILDEVMIFDASGGSSIPKGETFEFEIQSAGAIVPNAFGNDVWLVHEDKLVGTGTITAVNDCDNALGDCLGATAEVTLNERVSISSFKTETFVVELDLAGLLDDEYFSESAVLFLQIIMTVDEQTVEGNVVYYSEES